MDTLSVELRLKIFGLVLRASASLSRVQDLGLKSSPLKEYDHLVEALRSRSLQPAHDISEVALFTVNRQVSRESRDAFYAINTIAVYQSIPEYSKLRLARRIELGSSHQATALGTITGLEAYIVGVFALTSHVQSVTIASEILFHQGPSVRQHLAKNGDYAAIKAHSIGILQVIPKMSLSGSIWLKDFPLTSALPQAHAMASTQADASTLYMLLTHPTMHAELAERIGSRLITTFSLWLRCYDNRRRLRKDPLAAKTMTPADRLCVQCFVNRASHAPAKLRTHPDMPILHEQLPDGVSLAELRLDSGHSPELVEWASEFLAYNLRHIEF